jgi:glycosyltransferase involved in cell wall biosynthesis
MLDVQHWCTVVMPCLNEQDGLAASCRSLGFGSAQLPPERCLLVLVDNGSTDSTLDICEGLRSEIGEVTQASTGCLRLPG